MQFVGDAGQHAVSEKDGGVIHAEDMKGFQSSANVGYR